MLEESSAWLELGRGEAKARDGVPALLPAVPGGRLGAAARVLLLPTVAFPLPWRRLGMLLPLYYTIVPVNRLHPSAIAKSC